MKTISAALIATFGVAGLSAQVPDNSPWPMLGHDAKHTCRAVATESSEQVRGTIKWTYDPDDTHDSSNEIDGIKGGVAIGPDGKIFFGTRGGRFICIDRNGDKVWSYPAHNANPFHNGAGGIVCTPALNEALDLGDTPTVPYDVYYVTVDGYLVSFTSSGSYRWSAQIGDGGDIFTHPVVGSNGRIYVTSRSGSGGSTHVHLKAYNKSGTLLWTYTPATHVNQEIFGGPTIGDDGTIYFVDTMGRVHAVTDNGTFASAKWSPAYFSLGGARVIGRAAAIDDSGTNPILYVPGFNGTGGTSGIFAIEDRGANEEARLHWPLEQIGETVYFPGFLEDFNIYDQSEREPFDQMDGSPMLDTDGQIWVGEQYFTYLPRMVRIREETRPLGHPFEGYLYADGWALRTQDGDEENEPLGNQDVTGWIAIDGEGNSYAVGAVYEDPLIISWDPTWDSNNPHGLGPVSQGGKRRWSLVPDTDPAPCLDLGFTALDSDGTIYIPSGDGDTPDGLLIAVNGP